MKYFKANSILFIFFIIIILYIFYPYYIFANSQCINYLAGIGEMEYYLDRYDGVELIGAGLLPRSRYDNLEIRYYFDKKVKTNGNASLNIQINRNGIIDSSISSDIQAIYLFFRNNLILPELHNTTTNLISEYRDYYPKSGDRLKISFDLKSENVSSNLFYKIEGAMWDNRNNRIIFNLINNTSNNFSNWATINFSTTVIDNIRYNGIMPFAFVVYLRYPNINTTSRANFWIDNLKLTVDRYNSTTNIWECIKFPNKMTNNILKFAEVFSINYPPYKDDWIYFYMNNELWDIPNYNYSHALRIYYHDRNFKLLEYIYPGQLPFREKINDGGSFRFKNDDIDKLNRGLKLNFDQLIKKVNDIPSSTWWNTDRDLKLTPNSMYPELFLLNASSNKLIGNHNYIYWDGRHGIHHLLNLKNINYVEYYTKHNFIDYGKNFENKDYLWGIRLDTPNSNMQQNIWRKSVNYSSENEARFYVIRNMYKEIVEKLKFSGKKIFANFGYNSTFNETGRYIGFDKFLDGYMDEGFLIERHLNFKSSQRTHNEIQSVIENFRNKYAILMSYTNKSWCTSTNDITNYLITAFYLVNNPGIYISFEMPTSDLSVIGNPNYQVSSGDYLCRTSVMNLPLGTPENIDNINQMIVTSTPNFNNGALYRRRYERGLVLLNSSDNLTFNYLLSSTTEPFTYYKDHLNRLYNFANNNINLQIPPRTGIILYNDEAVVE